MTKDVALSTALRAPVQGRSKASYERMLAAAEALMAAAGSDEFTLQEVSKKGKVSIGSIYNRFESKDALLHAVQLRVLERVDKQMGAMLDEARNGANTLDQLVVALTRAVGETLKENADIMRPLMLRATNDPLVSATGKASYVSSANAVKGALLLHSAEMKQPDPLRAVDSAFRILYATIARYLGFGSATTAAWEGDWDVLMQDLSRMIAAFLVTPPSF
ncbi:TetR/AcrR family transcriptional regulator [Novosphingobium sediminicola]|uniref:AcrR family transcriptional regulator n=1 Tax=Novosphingobium sediminicola TaxID=563162 RepID=A0A7W6CJA3_9SPHN|nr:TetR/AcrR family transcriptional regulator [Novosphingobium sediminicola]MBB3957588.1 AcrR family transcriptional regulator [Novosphingobium sediminicola]